MPEEKWKLSAHHRFLDISTIWKKGIDGEGITVAVIDDGFTEPPGLIRNFEFLKSDGSVTVPLPQEYASNHGTSCLSLIGSQKGGALGIAPMVKITAIEAHGLDDDMEAFSYITEKRDDIDIVSCSFTMPSLVTRVQTSIKVLTDSGRLVVASAGNDYRFRYPFPEEYPDVISVGAVDGTARPMPGLARGAWISIYAPGDALPVVGPVNRYGRQAILSFSKTSAAAAVVSGVAALVLSNYTSLSLEGRREKAKRFMEFLTATAKPMKGDAYYRYIQGIINPKGILARYEQEDS